MAARRGVQRLASETAGRVIAGTARGVRLAGPGDATRPLGDRVKQSLFAILEPAIRGRAFLDLFAGSGAAGIEALSRGADRAVLVDWNRRAVAAIKHNLAAAGFDDGRAVVEPVVVQAYLARVGSPHMPPSRFGAVFVDPPYDLPDQLATTLEDIAATAPNKILAVDGVLVLKHFWKVDLPPERGLLRSFREERFGETTLTFYRWSSADEGEEIG